MYIISLCNSFQRCSNATRSFDLFLYPTRALCRHPIYSDPIPEVSIGGRPSILVVDDARVNRLLLSRMLGELDVTVSTANDGEEAVRFCSAQKYSAILMDMCMVRCFTVQCLLCALGVIYDAPWKRGAV